MNGQERIEASAPARLCLGGESLDWMTNGPSVVGAITLRTNASVEYLPTIHDHHIIFLRSNSPIPSETLRFWNDPYWYTDPYLKYVESSVDVVRYDIKQPHSFAVTIESTIPVKAGISSSAAVTLATTAAVSSFLGLKLSVTDICEMAFEVEHSKLRTGAGRMDFYACGLGGLQYLNSGTSPVHAEPYKFPDELKVILADTRIPHETKSFSSSKRQRFQRGDADILSYADEAELLVERLRGLLPSFLDNREEIGSIITGFHTLLRDSVRCSTDLLDICVTTATLNGALGAKLTGSGFGGCMFALVDENHGEQVALALQKLPVRVYETTIVQDGVLIAEGIR